MKRVKLVLVNIATPEYSFIWIDMDVRDIRTSLAKTFSIPIPRVSVGSWIADLLRRARYWLRDTVNLYVLANSKMVVDTSNLGIAEWACGAMFKPTQEANVVKTLMPAWY
jgi:hypothetical protein